MYDNVYENNGENIMPELENICSNSENNRHIPDWSTITVTFDGGEYYIDISCKECGASGCIGNQKTLVEGINW